MERREKAEYILEQMRLVLQKNDFVSRAAHPFEHSFMFFMNIHSCSS